MNVIRIAEWSSILFSEQCIIVNIAQKKQGYSLSIYHMDHHLGAERYEFSLFIALKFCGALVYSLGKAMAMDWT